MFRLYYIITFPITILELMLLWIYRKVIRYALSDSCRYIPTCSKYAWDCLIEFGAILGTVLAIKRLVRCRPNHEAGYDFPKMNLLGNYKWKC